MSPNLSRMLDRGLYSELVMLTENAAGDQYLERTFTAAQTSAPVNTTVPAEKTSDPERLAVDDPLHRQRPPEQRDERDEDQSSPRGC